MKKLILCIVPGIFAWGYSQSQPAVDSISIWNRITALENRYLADFPKTFSEVKAELINAQASDCQSCKGRASMAVGKFYWANGQYNEGLVYLRKAIDVAKKVNDNDTWSKSTDLIANTYYYQAYYDSAEYYFNKAYAISEEASDVEGMIIILHDMSLMYHRKGDFKKTIEYIFKEERLKRLRPQSRHYIEAMGAMGPLMIDSIYYNESINDELKNLKIFQEENKPYEVFHTYQNLGRAYRQLKDHLTAAHYFLEACKTMKDLGLIPNWDLAAIDFRDANMKDSCFYYHYLAKQEMYHSTQPNVAYTLEVLGDAHLYFNRPDSALYYYDSALTLNYKMNNRITYTGIHRYLVKVNTLLHNYDQAEYHLKTGLKLAKEVALIHEKNLFNEGTFLYETLGDYKKALFFSEKYKVYLDSINRQETAINLTKMQAEFETEKKESELNDMIHINLLNQEKIKTRNLQIVLATLSTILVGSFGILYYSKFRQKKKATQQLERQKHIIEHQYGIVRKQNEDKEALLHEIHHRVKNNLQIISSLISIKSRNASVEIKEILDSLNSRIYSLGLVHEMLYESDHLGSVDLKEYLTEQSHLTLSSLQPTDGNIKLRIEIERIETNLDYALALGLISNELITNAIKYAFTPTHTAKTICVFLRKTMSHVVFKITDNGDRSFPDEFEQKKSFGLRFVEQLVKSKLNGKIHFKHEQGLQIEMSLKPVNT